MYIPLSILPGTTKLFGDYCTNFAKIEEFFSANYQDSSAYPQLASKISECKHADRNQVVQILTEQNRLLGAGEKTYLNLSLLAKPETLVVVTGQQVGILGGPLYTIYKALTTCKLAEHLSNQLQCHVVPVFYLVSEDHDFEEIRWFGILDENSQFQKIHYNHINHKERQPVSDIRLDDSIVDVLFELERHTPASEFKRDILTVIERSYKPGNNLSFAFASWFCHLLHDWGIIFLDASDVRLKKLAAPVFAQEITEDLAGKAISKTNNRLIAHDYHIQLSSPPNRPQFFLLRDGRHSVQREGPYFRNLNDNSKLSIAELLSMPEQLSPKAGLRPIIQDYLLPTLAYVGGPGEIAYWAQLKGVYQSFDLIMPIVFPRASFTLVEPKVKRLLDRFGISITEILSDNVGAIHRIRQQNLPDDLNQIIARLKTNLQKDWVLLQKHVQTIDPTLLAPAEKTEKHLINSLVQFEKKIIASFDQKDKILSAQYRSLVEAILPGGLLQERQLNIAPFLFKYNWPLIQKIFEAIDIHHIEHQIIFL